MILRYRYTDLIWSWSWLPGGDDLQQYHAMSVTEWLDVETVSGAPLRLLRIRNPWGRRGTWIDGCVTCMGLFVQ